MGFVTGLAVYFIVWWITLFMVLPFGVNRQKEVEEGHDPGAPDKSRILIKMAINTVVAFVVWLAIYLVDAHDLITIENFTPSNRTVN
jgi:predicted secreted protein